MPYGNSGTSGTTGKTNYRSGGYPSPGSSKRTIKASWIATVEEAHANNEKKTLFLRVVTQKNERLQAWHPATIQAILDRANRPDFTLVVKTRESDGKVFKNLYIEFPKSQN